MQKESVKRVFIFLLSTAMLICGFFSNGWNVIDDIFFNNEELTGAYVVARIVKSQQDGIFSDGGLPGLGSPEDSITHYGKHMKYQYSTYTNGLKFNSYKTYNSQIGAQGMVFSILDRLLPFAPQVKLQFYYVLSSLLSAIAIAFVILWFYIEFGMFIALLVMISAVFSQWLVPYGRNMLWSLWAFYIPIIAVMFFFRRNRSASSHIKAGCGIVVFTSVFIKCLFNGYEYITTTLIMMMVPFVYYYFLVPLDNRLFLKLVFKAILFSSLAILISIVILFGQIAAVKGNFSAGVDHIVDRFHIRTHSEPQNNSLQDQNSSIGKSMKADTKEVVKLYLNGTFTDLNNYISHSPVVSRFLFKITYWDLISLFLIMSAVLYPGRTTSAITKERQNRLTLIIAICLSILAPISWFTIFRSHKFFTLTDTLKLFLIVSAVLYFRSKCVPTTDRQKRLALIFATWVSILAPLSWFIIFKSHSFIHGQNMITWQMPFTFFGFAVFGLAVKNVFHEILGLLRSSS